MRVVIAEKTRGSMEKRTEHQPRLLVNVGCGLTRPAGWINTDSSINSVVQDIPYIRRIWRRIHNSTIYDRRAKYMDLRSRWPFGEGSVAVLYASHVFEHLSISQRKHFLGEAKRVLRIEGIIRIVVPDLERLAAVYLASVGHGEASAASKFLSVINMHAENSYPPSRHVLLKVINAVQGNPHQHKYMYDKPSMTELLSESGFEEVRFAQYGVSTYISRILDVECTAEGVPSIYVEAIRRHKLSR